MNPETTPIAQRAESIPPVPGVAEYQPNSPETGFDQYAVSPPRAEQAPAAPVVPALPTVAATPQPSPVRADNSDAVVAGAPSIAGDDDLIEKEWVDKLKSLITLTEGNPHEKARVIAQLQADYLKKRYNKTLGQSHE